MGKIMRNGKKYSGASSSIAENIVYDNTESGLEASDVQGAVDELNISVNELNSNFDEQNKKFETEVLTDVITPVNGITLSNVKVLRYGKNIYASFIASWSDASQQVDLAYIDNSILPVAPVISSCQVKDNDVYYMGIVKHTSTNILTAYISKTTKALDISAHWIIA